MTSLETQRLGVPAGAHDRRVLDFARERAVDGLAGRTVWCTTALPGARRSARSLHACLQWAGTDGVGAGWLEVAGDEPFRALAERLDAMLAGDPEIGAQPGSAERETYARGMERSEALVGNDVAEGDVVVLHDPLTAALAEAARERGAHAVWRVRAWAGPGGAAAREAWGFLRPYTSAMDAYLAAWIQPGRRGQRVERVAALMPSADMVAATDIETRGTEHDVGWAAALADVVESDRRETVGGTLRSRPTVAAR